MPGPDPRLNDLFTDGAAALYRELCERSLHRFTRHFWAEMDPAVYADGWHIGAICEHLEAVSRGEIRRLLINIPPRHMKSLTCCVAWPAWTWARAPDKAFPLIGPQVRFMSLSYSGRFAERDSRKMLNLVNSLKYQRYWGDRVQIAHDQSGRTRFETTAKGFRLPSSVKGMATGEGGDIILIDDPISADDAKSEPERQRVIDWWTEVMQTRLNDPKTGAFVIIMQRLHHQDLTGHVLANETGWTHLCLPAEYEPDHPHAYADDPRTEDGQLLWPAHIPEEELARLQSGMTRYAIAGQFQQRPAPRSGGMFDREHLQIVPDAPARGETVRGWDLAGSDRTKSPYTTGIRMKRVGDEYFVTDVVRKRTTPAKMHDLIVATAKLDGKSVTQDIPQDPGQAGKDQRRILIGKLAGYKARSTVETGAKEVRAEPYSAQWESKNVYVVEAPWNNDYVEELELFPNSDYSDQVDGSSRAFARLAKKKRTSFGQAVVIGAG